MNVQDAISAVRVMLGQDISTKRIKSRFEDKKEEEVTVKMANAVLVDGTPVYSEGELVVGATLYVKTPEGEEDVLAPLGKHELETGEIVTVGEAGLIESIEEVVTEEVPSDVVVEELEDVEVKEEEMDAESLLAAIADMIKGYAVEVETVKEELSQITERFNAIADSPAGAPVKKSYFKQAIAAKEVAEARVDHLSTMRRKTLTK